MTPVVSVIVCHHLDENRGYLAACLESLSRQEGVEFEAIVISDAPTCPEVPEGMTLVHNRELNTATKKIHFGIAMADPGSKYFLLLSDDVVMGTYTLRNLVAGAGDAHVICNPMSNSDNGGQFIADLPIPCELDLGQLENPRGFADGHALYRQILIYRPYVCFYCTLIPRKVWERVGALDERLENRHNDQDFCYRAGLLGIPSLINLAAFAVHFGSKTLNKVAPAELRDEASRAFIEKWKGKSIPS